MTVMAIVATSKRRAPRFEADYRLALKRSLAVLVVARNLNIHKARSTQRKSELLNAPPAQLEQIELSS